MSELDQLVLVPIPRTIRNRRGQFTIPSRGEIVCQGDPQLVGPIAARVQQMLRPAGNDDTWPRRMSSAAERPDPVAAAMTGMIRPRRRASRRLCLR